ncbi:MAG: hypothetical protein Q8R28_04580, partial [Dehalococcoidia bacterium]|nr:hypothetical protein [Dehalococcoidia bacterium]
VEVYSQWCAGEVYFFALEKKTWTGCPEGCEGSDADCEDCGYEYEDEDSCGGFYGDNPFENGMADHIDQQYHGLLKEL